MNLTGKCASSPKRRARAVALDGRGAGRQDAPAAYWMLLARSGPGQLSRSRRLVRHRPERGSTWGCSPASRREEADPVPTRAELAG
jgi:hypothetical protein